MTDYTCPTHGVNYNDADLPFFVKSCYCPECLDAKSRRILKEQQAFDHEYRTWHDWLRRSGVPARGRNRTLENWMPQGRAQQAAGNLLKSYANGIAEQIRAGNGLTLFGPPGVGKTHLSCGLIAAAYRGGIGGRYIVWADVLDRRKSSFANRDIDRSLLEDLKQTPLLVLDEIGCRAGSEFDQALLFDLIDTRYCQQRATIVATNLTADTFDSIGERAADRLREANVTVNIPGESHRMNASNNRALIDAPPALVEPAPPVIPFQACINGELIDRPLSISKPEVW